MRPEKTTVKKCGKRSFEITFSQKDGEALAKRIRDGGQSVIGKDDNCYVLYNGSKDKEFEMVNHWYPEAATAFKDYLIARSPETL